MKLLTRRTKFYFLAFLKHDFKASITLFLVALPLALGISLASNSPIYSGLVAAVVGGILVTVLSGSGLSVSGPAAGLTAICAAAITELGSVEALFLSVTVAGILQIFLGIFRLGGFTHFIPSAVIKGMLAAIGIILISKQAPLLIGYGLPDFWSKEMINIITLNHIFEHLDSVYINSSFGVAFISLVSFATLIFIKPILDKKITFVPTAFFIVIFGILTPVFFEKYVPALSLKPSQFVSVPENLFTEIKFPDYDAVFSNVNILKNAFLICFVATLETLLSVEAIDKLDPFNRITPQNRELVAQGTGNFVSGLLGGLPITAVIVRSSANAEAGARTKLSAFFHGVWLFVLILFAGKILNKIPYCVLAVILVRTGYNLAKPKMIFSVYKLGKEQFFPFAFTVVATLLTDLLLGVCIGIAYATYFILKNTYKAGYLLEEVLKGETKHYSFRLADNVSFINKKRLKDELEKVPDFSVVKIDGSHCVYIDYDVLEIISEFKTKAHHKHIELNLSGVPEVETIVVH
ncbi:SulP family inorganic anion transporter [bacterium]|nr:SulP family inorganic anion transporter [bacterium]